MTHDDIFLRFLWRDRYGLIWSVRFAENPVGFSGYVASKGVRETGSVHLQTHDIDDQKQSMARLADVRVDAPIENRGLGSMLVRKAIEECIRSGHKGVYGYLSEADGDHFLKLKHFYQKLGFSVGFYSEEHPDYRFDRVGEVEMIFDNVREEP